MNSTHSIVNHVATHSIYPPSQSGLQTTGQIGECQNVRYDENPVYSLQIIQRGGATAQQKVLNQLAAAQSSDDGQTVHDLFDKCGPKAHCLIGHLILGPKDNNGFVPTNPDDVLRKSLNRVIGRYNESVMAMQDLKKSRFRQAQAKLDLCTTLGVIAWPEFKRGRPEINSPEEGFKQKPLYSQATRETAKTVLDQAVEKGIISPEARGHALDWFSSQTPPQDVIGLLSEGKAMIRVYRSVAMNEGKPLIKSHVEVHPTNAGATEVSAFQLYDTRDHASNGASMKALRDYLDKQGFPYEMTSRRALNPRVQQLIDDPHATLARKAIVSDDKPEISPVKKPIRDLILTISKTNCDLTTPHLSRKVRYALESDLFILQGMLQRHLQNNLNLEEAENIKAVYEGLGNNKNISANTYARAVNALNSAVANLPREKRGDYIPLLCSGIKPLANEHVLRLSEGKPSEFLQTLDDVAKTVATVMPKEKKAGII